MLLDLFEEILPIGSDMWENVTTKFNAWAKNNGRPLRDKASLIQKFNKLSKHKKPTGDPDCPPDVKRAKRALRRAEQNADVVEMGGDDDEEDEEQDELSSASDDDLPGCITFSC